ncbi:MAG: hypothetical protein MZV63_14315 [Marinilabiliales bacterium]|nr:hypothetical protein [Marinilabiliales bacterium]
MLADYLLSKEKTSLDKGIRCLDTWLRNARLKNGPLPLPLRLSHRSRGPQERGPGRLQPRPRRAGLLRGLRPGRPLRAEQAGVPQRRARRLRLRGQGPEGRRALRQGLDERRQGRRPRGHDRRLPHPAPRHGLPGHAQGGLPRRRRSGPTRSTSGHSPATASPRPGRSTRTASTRSRRRRSSRAPSSSTTSRGRRCTCSQAEDVSYYLATWQWSYSVPYAEGTVLREMGYDTYGGTAVSTQHHHQDPYALIIVNDWLKLAELTGKAAVARAGPGGLGQRDDRHLGRRPRRHGQEAALRQPGRGLPAHALAAALRRQPVARGLAVGVPPGDPPPEPQLDRVQ